MVRVALLLSVLFLAAPLQAQEPPDDARFVASSRGQVFYPVGCRAVWGRLAPANLRWFATSGEATGAGYTPTTNRRCQNYWTVLPDPPELRVDVRATDGPVGVVSLARPPAMDRTCPVERVIDGDTLVCEGGERIRLLLIDAPETGQGPFGRAARQALMDLVSGRTLGVEYDVERTDRYGRTLAYLWSEDGQVNALMVAQGMALIATYPPNVKYVDPILTLQRAARAAGIGLWSVDGFECRPEDYRAGRCGG